MTWRAYLAHTMDGQLGTELDIAAGSATVTLNGIEDLSVTASTASLDGVERSWWSPGSGALVLTFEDAWAPERVIAAGPLTAPVKQNLRAGTVTLTAKGIGALLERRVVTAADYRPGEEAVLKKSVLAWTGVDLGSIVGRIITAATSKRSGWLPIVIPPERVGTRQRTYEGFNVANNFAWKRITEITEVIGGPDVMLRPRFADRPFPHVEWVLVTGSEAQPTLPQEHAIVWDTTAADSPVATVTPISNASDLAYRVYATGAGEGAGVAMRIAEAVLPEHMPLVEAVVSESDTENLSLLEEKARARIVTQATDQLSLTVHNHETSPLGTWRVGDAATVVTEGWLDVPDGEHRLRVISAKYDLASAVVQVECQEEVLGRELSW